MFPKCVISSATFSPSKPKSALAAPREAPQLGFKGFSFSKEAIGQHNMSDSGAPPQAKGGGQAVGRRDAANSLLQFLQPKPGAAQPPPAVPPRPTDAQLKNSQFPDSSTNSQLPYIVQTNKLPIPLQLTNPQSPYSPTKTPNPPTAQQTPNPPTAQQTPNPLKISTNSQFPQKLNKRQTPFKHQSQTRLTPQRAQQRNALNKHSR